MFPVAGSHPIAVRSDLTGSVFNTFGGLCTIEHNFIWVNDIMPHASEDQKAIGQKSAGHVRKEMALPRVARSAQRPVGDAATLGIPSRDSN